MNYLKKLSVAGALLGASLMYTGSAHAFAVNPLSGIAFGDADSTNAVADNPTTGLDGGLSPVPNLAISDELDFGSDGEFRFKFENTNATDNLLVTMSVTENYTPYVQNFTAEWTNEAGDTLGAPHVGLPVTSIGPLNVVVASGAIFYLVVTWDGVVDALAGQDGEGKNPQLLFTLTHDTTDAELTPVPVPPSLALFGTALLGMGFLTARRRRKSTSA